MSAEQLTGRYFELKQALQIAYIARPWQSDRIDRLANQLTLIEQEIVDQRSAAQTQTGLQPSA